MVSLSRLKELLRYDPQTGEFIWLVDRLNAVPGDIAGSDAAYGYRKICIDKRIYASHRLAWFYVHGVWPRQELDHINGVRNDNRIKNLREATHAENQQNKGVMRNNTSGHPGVSWNKARGKWRAYITAYGKQHHLGLYESFSEAVDARKKAKPVIHHFQEADRVR